MKIKVYRIEHKTDRRGPYTGMADICTSRYYDDNHPGPSGDGMDTYAMTWNHIFGFSYMRQMLTWFRFRDIFRIRKQGFRVYRYKIDRSDVIFGGRQVAFNRTRATVREEVPLSRMMRHLATPFGS
jgi:hypothetical protein